MTEHDTGVLTKRFEAFARDYPDLALYGRIAAGVARDPEIAGMLDAAPAGQRLSVLLFAAVHALVLEGTDHPIARYYPSVSRAPVPADDPFPAFRSFCLERRDELTALIATRATQTNEPNRSIAVAALVAAASADEPGRPLALVELGASAGLNLLFDSYRLEVGDVVAGDPASPVRLRARQLGDVAPPLQPSAPVVARVGIDREPVDVHDDESVRWLEACVWPEQVERVERFRAAVALARASPPAMVAGDMIERLPAIVAGLPPDAHVVIFHTWALVFVAHAERDELAAAIADLATAGRSITWASAEGAGVVPGIADPGPSAGEGTLTVLGLTRFRHGRGEPGQAVGRCHAHVAWIEWF